MMMKIPKTGLIPSLSGAAARVSASFLSFSSEVMIPPVGIPHYMILAQMTCVRQWVARLARLLSEIWFKRRQNNDLIFVGQ
jgi:hypothetical protein